MFVFRSYFRLKKLLFLGLGFGLRSIELGLLKGLDVNWFGD